MRIFCRRNVRDEALFLAVEVYEHKRGKNKDANDSIATECCLRPEVGDKQATNDCATTATKTVMKSLQDALRRRS